MKYLKNVEFEDNTRKLKKTDWIIIGLMVLIYGIMSFIRLGDTSAPNTYKTFKYAGDEEVVSINKASYISKMRYYTGNNLGKITIYTSLDNKDYEKVTDIDIGSVFSWKDININKNAKYIKFVAVDDGSTLGDVVFYDGNLVTLSMNQDKHNPLTDEIDLVPEEISYMNSTYFDEIYYARSAYEYLHGINVYEWTHPPLGKLLMTIPIAIFGFSPFSYRLMGNLFGILLIPIMYILAKRIFKNRKWAILAGLIMMFDNFHFVHTRIALVDGFQVTFILLSVLFMKEYMDLNKDDEFKKKTLYLLLSGLFIGCAIATKWNALYVGLGLAVTYFIHLFKSYNVNLIKYLKNNITIERILKALTFLVLIPYGTYYILFAIISKDFGQIIVYVYYFVLLSALLVKFFMFLGKDKYLIKLMGVSVFSFIIVPVLIYILTFILFPTVSYYDGTLKGIISMNEMMYNYHAHLDATHPFSSVWYQWPIMAKPVWLYTGSTLSNLRMTITDIGNPAIWWSGLVAFVYLVISSIKKNTNSIFITVFILSTFIPYVFIGRLMFMYHYFITLPFVMLGIVAFMKWITEKTKNDKAYIGFIILIVVTFNVFYPIVSGMPVKGEYIESLKWLSSWSF